MSYFFTSESVSEGHPDKVADQISDALIDQFLAFDPSSKVACETLVTTGQVILAGEGKAHSASMAAAWMDERVQHGDHEERAASRASRPHAEAW